MKNPAMQETPVLSRSWDDPLEKRMATHSSILAWRIPWIEELAGYSPWRREELDTTEQLTVSLFIFIHVYVCVCVCVSMYTVEPGVGNGNPLQYSCLENPMDSRA